MPLIGLQGREGAKAAGEEESALQWPVLSQGTHLDSPAVEPGDGKIRCVCGGGGRRQVWLTEKGNMCPKSEDLLQEWGTSCPSDQSVFKPEVQIAKCSFG